MLPRSSRLSRPAFSRVFKTKVRMRLPFGQVLFVPGEAFKVSIVISKKVEPTAVGRNQLRRRLYAALKGQQTAGIQGEFIVMTTPQITKESFPEVVHHLAEAMRSLSRSPSPR